MGKVRTSVAFVAALLLAGPAPAAPVFGKKVRVALLDVRAVPPVAQEAVDGMNPLLAGAAAELEGVQLLTSADLRAVVGLEQKQDILHCEQASCMAEIGRELGIDYVVAPQIAEVGGVYLVSFSLFSVALSRPVTRLTKAPRFHEQVLGAGVTGIGELLRRGASLAAEPSRKRRKVAVLETSANASLPGSGPGLAALISSEIAASGDAEVLAAADIQAMISADQRGLLACDPGSPACLTEIGGALGVDQVVTSELSRAGPEWVIGLTVVDVRHGQTLARVVKQVEQAGNITDAASLVVKEALFDLSGAPLAATTGEPTGTMVRGGTHARRDGLAWLVAGTGVSALGAGGYFWWSSRDVEQRDAAARQAGTDERATPEEMAGAIRDDGLGTALVASGLVLTGFATWYLLTGEDDAVPAGVQR